MDFIIQPLEAGMDLELNVDMSNKNCVVNKVEQCGCIINDVAGCGCNQS